MRKIEQVILRSALVLLCALAGLRVTSAQVYSGTLTGVVTDPAGAVVPGAAVTLTDQNKGFKFSTKTEQDGRYVFRNLAPGTYTLDAAFAGMRTYTRRDVSLTVGQNAQADITFELAGAQQRVEITASAPLLQTQDASTGQLVNQKFINDLPLTSRSVFNLAQLAPGVSQPPGGTFGLNQGAVNFVSNGGRNSTADIVMDGASQTDQENNGGITTALYTPPVDAVQEFNVQQNAYNAEIGFGGNTVINVVTKSGTNQFHGSLFEFLQNSDLNANNWFNNQNRIGIAPSKRNQFGGTFGGPIRKDKTFFFVDYQGTISRNGGTARAGVPSVAERQGDFGELCARNGGAFDATGMCSKAAGQLWDPMTGTYSSSLGGAVRSQFIPFNNLAIYQSPGNPNLVGTAYQLAATRGNLIDPVALKMMQYFPLPNVAVGTPSYNPLNNWIGSTLGTSSDHRFDVKVDHRLSDASLLSGRFSRAQGDSHGGNCFGINVADPCTQGPNNQSCDLHFPISFNHTFSHDTDPEPQLRLRAQLCVYGGRGPGFSGDFSPVTTLGMPQYILTSGYVATPNITFGNGYQSVSGQNLGSQTFSILHYPLDTHDLNASLGKVHGKHDLKFGYEGRLHIVSYLQVSYPEGQFSFSQTGTSQTPASGTGGDPLASLLIGFPQGGSGYQVDVAVTTRNFAHAWYAQDNWRVSDRLTVNLGLRYAELTAAPRTRALQPTKLDRSQCDLAAAGPRTAATQGRAGVRERQRSGPL